MKNIHRQRVVLLLTTLFVLLVGFQNCMDSDFSGQIRDLNAVNSLKNSENITLNLSDFTVVQSIAAGSHHTCVILGSNDKFIEGGLVKCWGRNDSGQLGVDSQNNDLPFVDLGANHTVKTLTAGDQHTCAILDSDQIKCWGANGNGQLGLGDANNRGDDAGSEMGDNLPFVDLGKDRTAKALFARYDYTCAILDNDQLKCWGNNYFGQLGLGDINNRGDEPYEMGDNLPFVDLGANRTAKVITAGKNHTCAILDNDKVKCWGINNFGQLGLGDSTSRGDHLDEMGDNLSFVDLGVNHSVKAITAGDSYTCAILDNDQMKCWGLNLLFGLTDFINYLGDETDEMGDHLEYVQLGDGHTAHFVAGGPYHVCLGLDNDQLKCWGRNDKGQLGLGDVAYRGDTNDESVDQLSSVDLGEGRTVKFVVAGNKHTCSILDNDKVKCWGSNEYHQLLPNDTVDHIGGRSDEMGTDLPYIDL